PCRDPRRRRDHLCQYRGFRRILYRGRRASRWRARDFVLAKYRRGTPPRGRGPASKREECREGGGVMHILVVTDAWKPQVNGVAHSLESVGRALGEIGNRIDYLTPQGFATIPMPTYAEIRLALATPRAVAKQIEAVAPEHIHIATEGPLGFAARRYCLRKKRIFTTSYHTRFPQYISARTPIPEKFTYAWLRRFHNSGYGVMVATKSIAEDLKNHGFQRLMRWSRGVDHSLF